MNSIGGKVIIGLAPVTAMTCWRRPFDQLQFFQTTLSSIIKF